MTQAPRIAPAAGGRIARPAGRITSPSVNIERACVAAFLAAAGGGHDQFPGDVCRRLWPDDRVAPMLLRSASAPATIADAAWAGALAGQAVGAFFSGLAASAASRLIAAGTSVPMDGLAEFSFPHHTAPLAGDLSWVGEGAPIQVRQFALDGAVLGPPKKLAVIAAMSGELAAHSAAEEVVTQLLREEAALSLDAALFSDAAASAVRPAGLLNGVTPLTATTGGGLAAMQTDLGALIGAVAAAAGNPETTVIIAAPAQAAAILVRAPDFRFPVWGSRALAAGTVIAIDAAAFASGFGAQPEIKASRDATIHFEDTTPLAIGTPGVPAVVATPTRSFFQQDLIGMRLIARVAFAMRAPGLVAVTTDTTW